MKQRRRGTIVTLSSAAARRAHTHNPIAYAAAKAGIERMTQALALQLGPSNIRVTSIAPETILTERNDQRIPDDLKPKHPRRCAGAPRALPQRSRKIARKCR